MSSGMLRTEAARVFAHHRGDRLTVVTMQAVEPWNALGQADSRNFNVTGCMGSAASIGLGLAIARPYDQVLVIDGDGSLMMQLGSCISIGEHSPRNLVHAVFANGIYETSGGQKVPGRDTADLCAIALASGYRHARRFSSLEELDAELDSVLSQDGPTFVEVLVAGPGIVEPTDASEPARKPVQVENMRLAFQPDAP